MITDLTQIVKDIITKSFSDANVGLLDETQWIYWLFTNIYGCPPCVLHYYGSDEKYLCMSKLAHKDGYDQIKSYKAIRNEYKDDCIYTYGETIFTTDGIISSDDIYLKDNIIPERIKKCLVPIKKKNHFLYASVGQGGFTTRDFNIKELSEDILDNYNDDLPIDKFNNFIESNESGICILNGEPGCGKTYFIRYLISKNPNKKFIWFDQSLLTQATTDSFVRFIIDNRDAILILEDCESLLKSRDLGRNDFINTVLNIADGIIGDSLNIKFICTFNTDYTNIDKAITRKGRLKLKYEFKKLKKDKVAKLYKKLGISDTPKDEALCEIFNHDITTGGEEKRVKIGF